MFHVEVRQFPHVATAFNLSGEQLEQRIVAPWCSGQPLMLDDRRFTPARARLTIYEGPALHSSEMGLGRGWANATRAGREVTARLLEEAQQSAPAAAGSSALARFKLELAERCAQAPVAMRDVVALAGQARPDGLVSERLALAEQAVWELLHEGHVRLRSTGEDREPAGADAWRATLMAWETWATRAVTIETAVGGSAAG